MTIPPFLAGALNRVVVTQLHHLIEPDATFADLNIDALDRLGLCCEIEEHLGCEIGDAEMEAWSGVGDLIASVARQQPAHLAPMGETL